MTSKTDLFTHPTTISRSQGELNSTLIQRDVDYFLTQLEFSRAVRATKTRDVSAEARAFAALYSIWERIDMSYLEQYGKAEYEEIDKKLREGDFKRVSEVWRTIKAFLYIKGLMKFDTTKFIDFTKLEEVNKHYGH